MELVKRLAAVRPTIEEVLILTGTAGIKYGVIHRGYIVHTESFGYRDTDQKLPVDEDTIFQVASLTKNMLAAAVGMLVEEGKLRWDTPIKDVLPDWNIRDPTVHHLTTITDCLSHRTGLQMNNYWLESNNNIVIPATDSMKLINGLKPVYSFRGRHQYNNLGYEIIGHAIRQVSGQTWNDTLSVSPIQQFGYESNRNTSRFRRKDNVSKAYGALSNGTPVRIGDAHIGDNTVAGSGGGVRSTLNNMLKSTKAWLDAAPHQFENRVTATSGLPLTQAIMSAQISIGSPSYHETSYAMGFART
ncbi:hypothetical protein N0V90_008025 [Kalmusia sp. IMI 367209]|nr:hypothetical protein N0V90_008025 [Kalmusia sp. IMI 367209]